MNITLVEEDVAKLRYEVVYLQELMKNRRVTLNRLVKKFRRIDFTRIQVSSSNVSPRGFTDALLQHPVKFLGRRDHTKEDVHMLMYKDEMKVCCVNGTRVLPTVVVT